MKNKWALLWVIWLLLLMAACSNAPDPAPAQSANYGVYTGTHLLRQIQPVTHSGSSISGAYFLFAGGISGSSSQETVVTFAWRGNDDTYRFTTLPLEKIRIHIDDSCVLPYVRFRWATHPDGDDAIKYVVLGVNSRDWPERIKVPLQ